ncbi:MAG: alpha-L-rhamnosidase, partial [Chitinophagia bacterium]|nr:alpha-L-rhamnosidase [Chitinophagia bacterium]
ASPNYDFLATLCGIRPSAPGFSAVAIEPALGELTEVKGSMPHPLGEIRVQLKRKGSHGIEGEVSLPDGLPGTLRWNGKTLTCKGKTRVSM